MRDEVCPRCAQSVGVIWTGTIARGVLSDADERRLRRAIRLACHILGRGAPTPTTCTASLDATLMELAALVRRSARTPRRTDARLEVVDVLADRLEELGSPDPQLRR